MKPTLIALTALLLLAAVVTHEGTLEGAPPAPAKPASGVRFADVTTASGIKFVHNSGRAGRKLLPETMGAGVALFDADGDGWLDVLFVNGRDWSPRGR